jgi:ABC-type dipeptide/oligopeptide/nickel transport system permease subunit
MGEDMKREKTFKEKLAFQLGRFLSFLKIFMRNRRGMLGLTIIAGFVLIAIFAPFLTPYDALGQDPNNPDLLLAGKNAAPAWLLRLPPELGGDPTLSENFQVINNPGLPKLEEDGGEFRLNATESIEVSYSETGFPYSFPGIDSVNGCLAITFSRKAGELKGETRVFLYKKFYFPYKGGPATFAGNIALYLNGTTHAETIFDWATYRYRTFKGFLDVPVRVRLYLGPVEDKKWIIWPPPYIPGLAFGVPYGFERQAGILNATASLIDLSNPLGSVWNYTDPEGENYQLNLTEWQDRDDDGVLSISDICTFQGNKTFIEYNVADLVLDEVIQLKISRLAITRIRSGREEDAYWIISRDSRASPHTQIPTVHERTEFKREGTRYAELVFQKNPGEYVLILEIIYDDINIDMKDKDVSTTVYVDDLDLFLYGTCFGILGTDFKHRDLFSQLIYGTRISLYLGLLVSVMAVSIGLFVGLLAGYTGRIADELLMRFNDLLLCLPGLPLLIVLVAVLGTSIENLILLMGLLGWNGFARLVRSQVLSLKERPFVEAAKAVGAGTGHIIYRHIVPNVMSLVYIALATSVPGAVTAEAALSWLGFYDPHRMSWGRMLFGIFEAGAVRNWWWVIAPGLCISLLAVSFILLGFALDDILNPKLRIRR